MSRLKSVLVEAVAVSALGTVLAFTANALSPSGLKLSRNYFPPETRAPINTNTIAAAAAQGTNKVSSTELLAKRVQDLGFRLLDHGQTVQHFQDPAYQLNEIIFIDARDDAHYTEGHIPGAFQLDYYRPDAYLPAILPVCQIARQIVIYCNGGDCEDSLLTAVFLRDGAQVPSEKLAIYSGGFTYWSTNSLPVELGVRGSGVLRAPTEPGK